MPVTLMTNELSLSARRHLEDSNQRLGDSLQRLATGSRIVKAADDAAGLAISDNLNAEVRSLGQAIRNAQDGISLIQIYEGGTNEINNMMMRMRELAMQASSDTVGDVERGMLNNEVQQLKQEVQRISLTTRFSGKNLLSGEEVNLEFQVGVHNDPEVDRIVFNPGNTDLTVSGLEIDGIEVSDKGNAQGSLEKLDNAILRVNDIRAKVGSAQSRLHSTITSQSIFQENLMAARSRIRDADVAQESSNLARESILRQAGVAVLTQANETPAIALKLLHL